MPPGPLEEQLASFGGFFAVDVLEDGSSPGAPWRPLTDLVADATVLRRRVLAVRAALADRRGLAPSRVELRLAASTAHLGLVARLVAPAVAAAALGGPRIDVRTDRLWWQDRLGVPYPLAVRPAPVGSQAGDVVLTGSAVEAVTDAVRRDFGVSPRALWGNIGSAANTAARLVAGARPDLAAAADSAADTLLADPRVDGGRVRSGPAFRRRSCCGIYRLPGRPSVLCGDCVLAR
ncbi:(2Fe-2S)-binding protein [Jatrophihabitans endophyticus]|uniref:(2Fe-2S)-binding protein n=1 Tax=Jatrophihabitans endophyticus TaxID=1206085 RepID=UPI0019DDA960|nr:(2Fe-2S)-binding protein [Jatrophihabitans endophyticus]MBE7187102.1 (2Fe-2S)-binding protein [Jatrophihabitans endophyticus]